MKNPKDILDDLHLEDLRNEEHPSIFDENEEYDMLIIRLPVISNELSAKSLGFILTNEGSYLYNKSEKKLETLDGRFEGPYKVIDRNADKILRAFSKYQDAIADMEELLYVDKIRDDFMNRWLLLKLEILRIERILQKTLDTLNDLIEYYEHIPEFPINNYMDIHEHIERTVRSAALQLSKLDYLYSFYNAKSNDKMNRMIYILTIISAVFLPLNLVVGFFGMNTSGLPFTTGSSGTSFALMIMTSLILVTSLGVYFWRKKVEK